MNKRILAGFACMLVALGCATRSQMDDMGQRVGLLEVKMTRMEQSIDKIRQGQADIKADLIDIRTDTQNLSGQLSSSAHDQEQKSSMQDSMIMQLQNLERQVQHIEKRLQIMETMLGLGAHPSAKASAPPGVPVPPVTPGPAASEALKEGEETTQPSTVKQAYTTAFTLYKDGNMEAARTAFEQFLETFPDSELSDNALFWIGETYYRTGNYKDAIVKYHQILEKHPKGSKAPDALLKLGLAFSMLGENEAATSSLKKVIRSYPNSPYAKAAQKKLETMQTSQKSSGREKKAKSVPKESP